MGTNICLLAVVLLMGTNICFVIVLGLTSTLVDNFVSSPRKREKRDSRGDKRTGMKVKKQNKNMPSLLLPATRIAGLAQL